MRLLVLAAAFGLVATLALAAPKVAFAQSAQDARAYEACLIGNFVLEFMEDAGDAGDAFDSAADLCSRGTAAAIRPVRRRHRAARRPSRAGTAGQCVTKQSAPLALISAQRRVASSIVGTGNLTR